VGVVLGQEFNEQTEIVSGARMNSISWTDLNPAEQRAIAVLAAGISIELCGTAALITIRRAGLVRGCCLTPKAEKLRRSAVLQAMAA
jgi:hypothetical protein